MMEEPDLDEEKKHDLEIISHEIDRVEGFLQNFLKYARPAKPQMQTVTIVPVIREILQLMQPRFRKNHIKLIEIHEDEGVRLNADPDMIKQVIMNLVLNAVESMGQEGELTIATKFSEENTAGKLFKISIIDNGSGIPQEILESLFDPFVKGKDQGVGLGLSISQRIAEQHHGWISALNNSGKGATFTLHLPVNS
jgi:signal transduction histidine kinase